MQESADLWNNQQPPRAAPQDEAKLGSKQPSRQLQYKEDGRAPSDASSQDSIEKMSIKSMSKKFNSVHAEDELVHLKMPEVKIQLN